MTNDPYPPAVNVTPPPMDPDETKRLFHELGKRKTWGLYGGDKDDSVMPPSDPPRPVGDDGDDDEGNPLPVAEISLTQMQEYVVKEEELKCWRCGATDHVHKLLENGAILCPGCEEILKP